jgi:hypothetical protein
MAGTVLKNILSFAGLVVGVPVSLPHLLTLNTNAVIPRILAANATGFTITANATNVTVTRTAAASSGAVEVYCEYWHTIEDCEPQGGIPTGFFPFVIAAGGGGSSGPTTPAFAYIASGGENTAGFPVVFPTPRSGGAPAYVAVVQVSEYQAGGIPEANAPPSGYTGTQITVTSTAPVFTAGDVISVIIADT